MKRQILKILSVLVGAYAALTCYAVFALFQIDASLNKGLEVETSFFLNTDEVLFHAKDLERIVAQSFVGSDRESIAEAKKLSDEVFEELEKHVQILFEPKFGELHGMRGLYSEAGSGSMLIDTAEASAKSHGNKDETVRNLLDRLVMEVVDIKEKSREAISANISRAETAKLLTDQRLELSRAFRTFESSGFVRSEEGRRALNDLTLATLTLMSSTLPADLNSSGRLKFDAGAVVLDSSLSGNEKYKAFKDAFNATFVTASTLGSNSADEYFFKFQQSKYGMIKDVVVLSEFANAQFQSQQKTAISSVTWVRNMSIVVSALVMIIGTLLAFRTLNQLTASIQDVIGRVTSEAQGVQAISKQVETASGNLAESVSEQASAIQETVSSMQEISSMISKTTELADTSRKTSQSGIQEAEVAGTVVRKLSDTMAELKDSNRRLEELVDTIKNIQDKTQVINDIVFKTQLLSFNASIEAARAGVHGKGFAVVAQEVGKLADLSGAAAAEINKLLQDSDKQVRASVDLTTQKVTAGSQVASECERAFGNLNQILKNIARSAESIAHASKEQMGGVAQTNDAMTQMDNTTQANSQSADDLSHTSGELQNRSDGLSRAITDLNVIVAGAEARVDGSGTAAGVLKAMQVKSKAKEKFAAARAKASTSKVTPKAGVNVTKVADSVGGDFDADDDSFKSAA